MTHNDWKRVKLQTGKKKRITCAILFAINIFNIVWMKLGFLTQQIE